MEGRKDNSADSSEKNPKEQESFDGAAFFLKCILSGVFIVYLIAVVPITLEKRDGVQPQSTSSAITTRIV